MLLWDYKKMISACWLVVLERDIFLALLFRSAKKQTCEVTRPTSQRTSKPLSAETLQKRHAFVLP